MGVREQHLLPWVLSFLRPYRGRLALFSVLLLFQVALGVLRPWPLAIVLDYVLVERALPAAVAGWITWITQGSRVTLLVMVVVVGVVLNLVNSLSRCTRCSSRWGPGSGSSTTSGTSSSNIFSRSPSTTTLPRTRATPYTESTSTPTRSTTS